MLAYVTLLLRKFLKQYLTLSNLYFRYKHFFVFVSAKEKLQAQWHIHVVDRII